MLVTWSTMEAKSCGVTDNYFRENSGYHEDRTMIAVEEVVPMVATEVVPTSN